MWRKTIHTIQQPEAAPLSKAAQEAQDILSQSLVKLKDKFLDVVKEEIKKNPPVIQTARSQEAGKNTKLQNGLKEKVEAKTSTNEGEALKDKV